jgi:Helix-turn-helix domain
LISPTTTQVNALLTHFRQKNSITADEARSLYQIRSLSRRICDVQGHLGVTLRKERRRDLTGRQYVRYHLA